MDAKTARTANIRRWVAEAGGPTDFSRAVDGRWGAPQVNQWISEGNPKPIGHVLARELEGALGRPAGSMDREKADALPASQPLTLDATKLDASIKFLEDLFGAHGKDFVHAKEGRLIAEVYAELLETPEPNLVELATRYGRRLDDGRQRQVGRTGEVDRTAVGERSGTAKAAAGRKGRSAR